MNARFYWLVLGVLAVWRVTHLLQAEDGPWDVVLRLRRAAGSTFLGRLLDCFYCTSVWVALPAALAIGGGAFERLLLWPALSGAAILLERATAPAAAHFIEDPPTEDDHGMLRTTEGDDGRKSAAGGDG
jgi:hypothetical protein